VKGKTGGSRLMDLARIREVTKDQRVWAGVGLVVKRSDQSDHWEKHTYDDGSVDILVDVDLVGPDPAPILCRLASQFGGQNLGAWRVPDEGTEVLVVIPNGALDAFPVIAATLSTGGVPNEFDANGKLVVVTDGDVVLVSKNGKIQANAANGTFEANGNNYSMLKTEDLLNDLLNLMDDLRGSVSGTAPIVISSSGVPTTPMTTHAQTIYGKLVSGAYKSSKAKNG
jgi:hypothetical protein